MVNYLNYFCNSWYFCRGTVSCSHFSRVRWACISSSYSFRRIGYFLDRISLACSSVWVLVLWEDISSICTSLLWEDQPSIWMTTSTKSACKFSWVAIVWVGMSSVWVSVGLPLHISVCIATVATSGVVFWALLFTISLIFRCSLLNVFWSFWYFCLNFFSFSLATHLSRGEYFTLTWLSIASISKYSCCLSRLCSNRNVSPDWLSDSWITFVCTSSC